MVKLKVPEFNLQLTMCSRVFYGWPQIFMFVAVIGSTSYIPSILKI